MIIGISGKFESGKGTVCNIIQAVSLWYNCPRKTDSWGDIYTFVWSYCRGGRKGSLESARDIYSDWEIVAFGDKLKHIVLKLTGEVVNLWTHAGKDRLSPIYTPDCERKYTYRELLQLFGTEVGRQISPNIWVDALFAEYSDQNWLIEDVRFPNEFDEIKSRGGLLIRCWRTDQKPSLHASETALDGKEGEFDYTIQFDPTLRTMTDDVIKILKEHDLLNLDYV